MPGDITVPVNMLKAHLAEYLARVADEGATLTITKRGRPVAELSPPRPAKKAKRKSPFGCMKGRGRILGDIVSPLDVEWNVLKPDAKLDPD
jgi:prevent-host-death family protein